MSDLFNGEEMQCCMCSKKQMSDPNIESNWTYISLGPHGYYVCPKHLEKCKTKDQFERAYTKILARINELGGGLL